MRLAAAVALALALAASPPSAAETVRVEAQGWIGQGWIFRQGASCLLVTARHVVEHEGRLARPLLVDESGAAGQAVDMSVPPDSLQVGGAPMDAALGRVVGALEGRCTDDLGYASLGPTLDRLKLNGAPVCFEKVQKEGSIEIVPAGIATINRDGARFTVGTSPGGAEVVAGDSGSPVRLRSADGFDRGLPLGLLTEVLGGGDAVVLRMDAIRRWVLGVRLAAPSAEAARQPFRILGWSAATPDDRCGPLNLLDAGAACGWRAAPSPGRSTADIDVAPKAGAEVAAVTVELEPGSSMAGVGVEARDASPAPADAAFDALVYCPAPPGAAALTCRFSPRTDSVLRVRIDKLKGGVKAISLAGQ